MASWGCPHEIDGKCSKFDAAVCDPGMKGCVLAGRFYFLGSDDKNRRLRARQERLAGDEEPPATASEA